MNGTSLAASKQAWNSASLLDKDTTFCVGDGWLDVPDRILTYVRTGMKTMGSIYVGGNF